MDGQADCLTASLPACWLTDNVSIVVAVVASFQFLLLLFSFRGIRLPFRDQISFDINTTTTTTAMLKA